MVAACGTRLRWDELPGHVRAAVERIIGGGPVVAATSQHGGFSPGTADRLVTADGARVFVKAVSPALNPDSPGLHRQEAVINASLPPGTPAPTLLGTHDDGEWIALVFADVGGRTPATPWRADELDATLAALELARTCLTPSPLPGLPGAQDVSACAHGGWALLRADPPADLDPVAREHLDELIALEARGIQALAGDTLLHVDLRADNVLIRPDGTAVLVDWPWACNGAWWLDPLLLLANVRFHGGHDVEALLHRACPDVDPDALTGALAGFVGFLLDHARRPDPPGIFTVRAFQRAQADALLPWLHARARW